MCNSIISRLRREAVGSFLARTRVRQLWKNIEPRPPETTGALVFEGAPKGPLQYRVKLASHDRAAVVQRLAGSEWLPNRLFCYGVFVAGKIAASRSISAGRAITDSATAVRAAASKRAKRSNANTTANISKVLRGEGVTQSGNGRIANAERKRK